MLEKVFWITVQLFYVLIFKALIEVTFLKIEIVSTERKGNEVTEKKRKEKEKKKKIRKRKKLDVKAFGLATFFHRPATEATIILLPCLLSKYCSDDMIHQKN